MPGVPKAKVAKRMILTPDHAKRLMNALQENVTKYEAEHGLIHNKTKDFLYIEVLKLRRKELK